MEVTKLPDPEEMLWLFEVEPEILDPDVPLPYNTLTYHTVRDGEEVTCVISPGYRDLELWWRRGERELLHLSLTAVAELRVVREGGAESLVARFDDDALEALAIQLKPAVAVRWGMG